MTGQRALAYFGGEPTAPFTLERPGSLDDRAWTAIDQALTRLNTAIGVHDLEWVIGCAKELAESVAKVVLASRGTPAASSAKFPDVLTNAHVALDRQPGKGLAADAQVRNIAQAAKTAASQLPELRNKYGTGHGRALAPEVADELALVAVDSALLWSRWVLRRLHHLLKGRPDLLIRDLEAGKFYRGELEERLTAARLAELEEADQHSVGFSVARRAMRDTFLVMEEGVEACAESSDLDRWPLGYRIGLLNGLFLTEAGLVDATPWSVEQVALLLQTTGHGLTAFFAELAKKLDEAAYGIRLNDDNAREGARYSVQRVRWQVPAAVRPSWQIVDDRLEVPF